MNTYEIIASSLKTVLDVSNESVLSTVSFDKTITAIITQVHDDGTYQVSNGTTKFKVSNSTDKEYTKGTSVKVLIPNGDYTKEKVIIGSTTTEDQKLSSYVAPESKFVAGEAYKDESLNLLLNLSTATGVSADLSDSVPIDYNNILNYNAIMIKLGLNTLTLKDLATKGAYTIQIKITNIPAIEISSSELFGNVYYLAPEITQTKMYSLTPEYKEYKLESITLSQEGFAGATEDAYINLKSLEIIFGWNKEKNYPIGDQIALVENTSLKFGTKDDNTEENITIVSTPNISLDCWIDNMFNKKADINAIKYYLYQVGYQGNDEEIAAAGTYWREIEPSEIKFEDYSDTWQEVLIKAVLKKFDDSYITSNILTYQNINKAKVEFTETRDQLIFTIPQTVYNIYGNDGKLITNLQDQTLKVCLASNLEIPARATIEWTFPDNLTQLIHTNKKNEETLDKDTKFVSTTFNFKRQYQPNWSNNTITCTIVESNGVSHTGSIGINIGSANTNGTSFSLNIVPLEGGTVFYGDPLTFTYSFQDADGNNIEIDDTSKLSWHWPTDSGEGYAIDEDTKNITITEYTAKEEEAILKLTYSDFTVDNGSTIDLVAYYPIPQSKNSDYAYMAGATSVIYDWQNLNPSYSRDAYKLYDKNGEEVENLVWELSGSSDLSLTTITTTNEKSEKILLSYLRPLAIKPTNPIASCICAIRGDKLVWSYPILISNNAYAFDVLNSWSGTKTKQGENYILSNLLGAGIKNNNDNTFTGVLIGAVGQFKNNNITNIATGLYGFQDSNLRFKFDENGDAWIGTTDNYISLNQDEGLKINTSKLLVNTARFKINSNAKNDEYIMQILGKDNNSLFSFNEKEGLKVNAAVIDGQLTANQIEASALTVESLSADKITAGTIPGSDSSSTAVKIGGWNVGSNSLWFGTKSKMMLAPNGSTKTVSGHEGSFAIYANGNFGVTTGGILYATGANISGTITASQITNGSTFTVTSDGVLTAKSGFIGSIAINENGLGIQDDSSWYSTYITTNLIRTDSLKVNRIILDSYGEQAYEDAIAAGQFYNQAFWFSGASAGNAETAYYTISIGSGGIALWWLNSGTYERTKIVPWSTFFTKMGV